MMERQSDSMQETVEIFKDSEITVFFHDGTPLVSFIPGGRKLLSTDGLRTEIQRKLINLVLSQEIITPDWLVGGQPFEDGMVVNL